MRFNLSIVFRNGIEYFAYPMADVILNQISDEQDCENDSDEGKGQEQVIDAVVAETVGQEIVGII